MTTHYLYLIIVPKRATQSTAIDASKKTLKVLRFLAPLQEQFNKMQVKIVIKCIKLHALASWLPFLTSHKITALPALQTPSYIYLGAQAIIDLYEEYIIKYKEWATRAPPVNPSPADPSPANEEEMLEQYYRQNLLDGDDHLDDNSTTMMKKYDARVAQTVKEPPLLKKDNLDSSEDIQDKDMDKLYWTKHEESL